MFINAHIFDIQQKNSVFTWPWLECFVLAQTLTTFWCDSCALCTPAICPWIIKKWSRILETGWKHLYNGAWSQQLGLACWQCSTLFVGHWHSMLIFSCIFFKTQGKLRLIGCQNQSIVAELDSGLTKTSSVSRAKRLKMQGLTSMYPLAIPLICAIFASVGWRQGTSWLSDSSLSVCHRLDTLYSCRNMERPGVTVIQTKEMCY